ncbi:MAG: hypothetical protein ABW185_25450 [Sedimenticola sp.]
MELEELDETLRQIYRVQTNLVEQAYRDDKRYDAIQQSVKNRLMKIISDQNDIIFGLAQENARLKSLVMMSRVSGSADL